MVRDGAKDTIVGLWDAVTSPVETLKVTWQTATHPIQTYNIVKNALIQSYDKNMVHGNAYTRTKWVTYALTTLATAAVGTKGVDKISKAAKAGKIGEAASKARAVTKTALAKHTESVNNRFNQWGKTLLPRTQFEDGLVPYNVIDAKGLKNKLQRLPDRNEPFTNQIDRVRDLIQQASANKGDGLSERTNSSVNKSSGSEKSKINVENLSMTETVSHHAKDIIKKGVNEGALSRPYIDSNGTNLLIQEIIDSRIPVKDASLPNGLRWDVMGSFNGRGKGTWELVIDLDTNKIVHFNFTK
jgi:Uncharacterized conserved protein